MSAPNSIAVIRNQKGVDPQMLLTEAIGRWGAEGFRIAGIVAEDHDGEGACSAGYLKDLASGKRFAIQLENAPAGTTCHLNAYGVEGACEALLPQIEAADVIVLSKFGKLEAMGQGLWRAFVAAADAGKPVLTTVSSRHAESWNDWVPTADWLEPNVTSIENWWRALGRGSKPCSLGRGAGSS